MRNFFLVLLLTITLTPLLAQVNFQQGYIITQTNEKIEGLIDNKDWRVNPEEIEFRKSASSASTVYNAITVKEFGVGNRTYWGRIVTLDQSIEKSDHLLLGKEEDKKEIDTLFLEVLIHGKISLLYAMSKNRKAHFLYESNGEIEELTIKRTVVSHQDALGNTTGKQVVTTDLFKGQLSYLMRDCPEIITQIEKIRLTTKDLQKLFSNYLNCIGATFQVEENSNKLSVNFGVTAGTFFSYLKFDPAISSYPSNDFFAFGIPFGATFDVTLAKNRGRFSIHNELLSNNYTYRYNKDADPNFKFSYLRLNSMFRIMSVDNGEVRYFANIGIGYGLMIAAELPSVPFKDYKNSEEVFNIGVGYQYRSFSLELRYERTTGFSPFIDLNDRINSFYILGAWQFKNK